MRVQMMRGEFAEREFERHQRHQTHSPITLDALHKELEQLYMAI